MRIGILSDTHNERENLLKAVQVFQQQKVDLLIHCGDLTDADLIQLLNSFQIIYVYGNMDKMTGQIKESLLRQSAGNFVGTFYSGEMDGVSIAAMHGDAMGQLYALIQSGKFNYIIHGHTHQFRDEAVNGTRIINPGALGGKHIEPRSICILDLQNGNLERISIE